MRKLTLNEKITFKGFFVKRGFQGPEITKLTLSSAMHYWTMIMGYRPLNYVFKIS